MTSQRVEVTSYILHLTLTRPWQDHSLITFHVNTEADKHNQQKLRYAVQNDGQKLPVPAIRVLEELKELVSL
jgi:hypothetical protein